MTTRCRRWTLSCAPHAGSWTLSRQRKFQQFSSLSFQMFKNDIRQAWALAHFASLYRCYTCSAYGVSHPPDMKRDFCYSNRLADVQEQLSETKNKSTTNLLASEDEILQLKAEFVMSSCTAVWVTIDVVRASLQWPSCLCFSLQTAHEQLEMYKRKANSLDDYEQRIRLLREEFSCLSRSRSPSSLSRPGRSSSNKRSESPTRAQLTNSSRHAWLVSRFNDLYAEQRLEAQALLHRYFDDLETVQRIIFIAVVVWLQTADVDGRQRLVFIQVVFGWLVFVCPGIFQCSQTGLSSVQTPNVEDAVSQPLWTRKPGGRVRGLHCQKPGSLWC